MQSLKELFKIGNGPSSSHTMGPKRAVEQFIKEHENMDYCLVKLYGSLALTGKGHLTDKVIKDTLSNYENEVIFDLNEKCDVHPNTFDIEAYKKEGKEKKLIDKWRVYSVGGGTYNIEGRQMVQFDNTIYKERNWEEVKAYCILNHKTLYNYVVDNEGEEIVAYLNEIWNSMKKTIEKGIRTTGTIPGKLRIERRSKEILGKIIDDRDDNLRRTRLVTAYAYATSEENACGGIMVTAPTAGASGVLPAVLYYMQKEYTFTDEDIIKALAVAGVIGNIIKTNASISGAECGCQAEIGTATSMASAACASLLGMDIDRIGNSAEISMEHSLGLTCDPVYGYVQIPCIERNAVGALRAIDSCFMALMLEQHTKISLDMVIETMYETGKDLQSHYRETSEGGLAKKYCRNKFYNQEMKE